MDSAGYLERLGVWITASHASPVGHKELFSTFPEA